MREPEPIITIDLFAPDRAALIDLLTNLSEKDWQRPTACPGWSVRDVATHLLGVDLGNLSIRRDGFRGLSPGPGEGTVAFVNRINDEWMRAGQRLSPRVLRELLAVVGPPLFTYFASLDPFAIGSGVSWAGLDQAPVWLDIAREYTERWHHQQHIRDAVGRPGQTAPRFLQPILATFAYALPRAFQDVPAPSGTTVQLRVTGEAGGDWTVQRERDQWKLYLGAPENPTARVSLDARTAWRLYTRGVSSEEARAVATLEGDKSLAEPVFHAVAIIA